MADYVGPPNHGFKASQDRPSSSPLGFDESFSLFYYIAHDMSCSTRSCQFFVRSPTYLLRIHDEYYLDFWLGVPLPLVILGLSLPSPPLSERVSG